MQASVVDDAVARERRYREQLYEGLQKTIDYGNETRRMAIKIQERQNEDRDTLRRWANTTARVDGLATDHKEALGRLDGLVRGNTSSIQQIVSTATHNRQALESVKSSVDRMHTNVDNNTAVMSRMESQMLMNKRTLDSLNRVSSGEKKEFKEVASHARDNKQALEEIKAMLQRLTVTVERNTEWVQGQQDYKRSS